MQNYCLSSGSSPPFSSPWADTSPKVDRTVKVQSGKLDEPFELKHECIASS
jgi:hypothetical protein